MPEMTDWIDLSHPLSESTPPFPGDPPVRIEVLDATDASDDRPREHLNCSRIELCVHCGTHMDAPYHFFANGDTIDRVALDACCGQAIRLRLADQIGNTPNAPIDAGALRSACPSLSLLPGRALPSRVLLDTGWYRKWGTPRYFEDHPVLTGDAARFLVEAGVRLVAVDFPSVDLPPFPAHIELLGSGVLIVENITNLHALPADVVDFAAIPLAISGRDGSPVRAMARSGGDRR